MGRFFTSAWLKMSAVAEEWGLHQTVLLARWQDRRHAGQLASFPLVWLSNRRAHAQHTVQSPSWRENKCANIYLFSFFPPPYPWSKKSEAWIHWKLYEIVWTQEIRHFCVINGNGHNIKKGKLLVSMTLSLWCLGTRHALEIFDVSLKSCNCFKVSI